jgi:hypothetical protein
MPGRILNTLNQKTLFRDLSISYPERVETDLNQDYFSLIKG